MSDILEERTITTAERYATATMSGNLTPRLDGLTDADVLLAAGIAALKSPERMLALRLYRMGTTGTMDGLWEVVAAADGWVVGHLLKIRRRPMTKQARQQLIADTLQWWLKPTCGYCNGCGFVQAMLEGTDETAGRLTTQACSGCHGTGRRPLAREVPAQMHEPAGWLVSELDRHVSLIHADMAKLLGKRMEL